MPEFPIRKIAILSEEILHDGGPPPASPRRRAAAMALVRNPFAGRYRGGLAAGDGGSEAARPELTERLIAALGGDPSRIDGYGKGAIVGTAGEIEHGALWHVPGGYAMRERLRQRRRSCPRR